MLTRPVFTGPYGGVTRPSCVSGRFYDFLGHNPYTPFPIDYELTEAGDDVSPYTPLSPEIQTCNQTFESPTGVRRPNSPVPPVGDGAPHSADQVCS